MPSEIISSLTRLATDVGWRDPLEVKPHEQVLGVDRHGQVRAHTVVLETLSAVEPLSYLGTVASFGAFAPSTRIQQSNGVAAPLQFLIERGTVQDLLFETVVPQFTDNACRISGQNFAQMFRGQPAIHDTYLLRCVEQSNDPHWHPDCISVRRILKQRFCLVDDAAARIYIKARWVKFIRALCRTAYYSKTDACIRIPRDQVDVTLWYLSTSDEPCCLSYDNLQHTCFIFGKTGDRNIPISHGRVAFRTSRKAPTVAISWEDRSWRPVASGFLLAGAQYA